MQQVIVKKALFKIQPGVVGVAAKQVGSFQSLCHDSFGVNSCSHHPVSLTDGVDAGGLTASCLANYYYLQGI